jgi:replicative DNA helicase
MNTTAPALIHYKNGRKAMSQTETDLSQYVFGKVQPQNIQIEEVVLGALMIDRQAFEMVADTLTPETFYLESHQAIYRAIAGLSDRSQPVDLLTVTDALRKSGDLEIIGGGYYLVELTTRIASAANIEYHARILAQCHIERQLISVGTGIIRAGYDSGQDVFEKLERAEKAIFQIGMKQGQSDGEKVGSLCMEVLRDAEAAMLKKEQGQVTGVPTGLTDLDSKTGGLQKSDLIIIAARPGVGKTGLVINTIAPAAAAAGMSVHVFSLEMSKTQLVGRMVAAESGISAQKMRRGELHHSDWQILQTAVEKIDNLRIFITDTPGISVSELSRMARRMKKKEDTQLIIVDYLQLMAGSGDRNGNREQDVATISRGLKSLAKELNVPVIAISSLSRAVETRGGTKRPILSDLRESGSIESDADIVAFIYRPEMYHINELEDGSSTKGLAEIEIAKHRGGATGTIQAFFEEEKTRFKNWPNTLFSPSQNFGTAPTTFQRVEPDEPPY